MQMRPAQLAGSLNKQLAPIYLLYGEEPLQKEECAEMIREACRREGIADRSVIHIDSADFDWNAVLLEYKSPSLFAQRKLLDLRLSASGPGKAGGAALRELVDNATSDIVVMLNCAKLDGSSRNTAWFKSIDRVGVVVTAWPITGRELTNWLGNRLRKAGVEAQPDALELIAARVEGNLLAAKQEIDLLALLARGAKLGASDVERLVADNARYTVFELAERCLGGKPADALRILQTLRAEGVAEPVVLWSLARELRRLYALAEAGPRDPEFAKQRIAPRFKSLYVQALKRLSLPDLLKLVHHAAQIDRVIKGLDRGNGWDELASLTYAMASVAGRDPRLPTAY